MEEGQKEQVVEEGQEKPVMEKGQEKPVMEEGQEKPVMEEGQEKPVMEEEQEKPVMEEGQEEPVMEEGQEEPMMEEEQKAENIAPNEVTVTAEEPIILESTLSVPIIVIEEASVAYEIEEDDFPIEEEREKEKVEQKGKSSQVITDFQDAQTVATVIADLFSLHQQQQQQIVIAQGKDQAVVKGGHKTRPEIRTAEVIYKAAARVIQDPTLPLSLRPCQGYIPGASVRGAKGGSNRQMVEQNRHNLLLYRHACTQGWEPNPARTVPMTVRDYGSKSRIKAAPKVEEWRIREERDKERRDHELAMQLGYETLVGNLLHINIPGGRDINRSWQNFLTEDALEWGFPYEKGTIERPRMKQPEPYLAHQGSSLIYYILVNVGLVRDTKICTDYKRQESVNEEQPSHHDNNLGQLSDNSNSQTTVSLRQQWLRSCGSFLDQEHSKAFKKIDGHRPGCPLVVSQRSTTGVAFIYFLTFLACGVTVVAAGAGLEQLPLQVSHHTCLSYRRSFMGYVTTPPLKITTLQCSS